MVQVYSENGTLNEDLMACFRNGPVIPRGHIISERIRATFEYQDSINTSANTDVKLARIIYYRFKSVRPLAS